MASTVPTTAAGAERRRRSRTTRRNAIISTVSTVVFFGLVALAVALSPGASAFIDAFFSVTGFRESFDAVLAGFWLNVRLMLVAEAIVLVFALALVYSAYVTEVYRAGIDSVHSSQVAGARSLGLSQWQSMRHVILPQAIRRVVPPLLNDFIGLQKDTALIGLLGLVEVARAAENYAGSAFNFTGYTVAALLFIAITIPLARATDYLIARDRRRMRAAGG